ncbi:MAG: ComEC family competence protein, partial [Alphaproteobacteria bacterium]|nr:ComEC family competence protein [Alphaproteobacteria bacterium]
WGCRLTMEERRISFSFHPSAHAADCQWADVLLADDPVRVKSCDASVVIDRFAVWKNGVHALWLAEGHIKSVGAHRGVRPWTVSNSR